MNRRIKYSALCIFIAWVYCYSSAQTHIVDSLRKVLKIQKSDTNRVNTLNALSECLWRTGLYDSSITYATTAKTLAEKLDYKIGIAGSLRNIGIIYYYQSNYPKALEADEKALGIAKKMENKRLMAKNYGNIGNIYSDQGDYPEALKYHLDALAINQQLNDTKGIGSNLSNIGLVYWNMHNYKQALEYGFKALAIEQKLGDKNAIATILGNIGSIYYAQTDYSNALGCMLKALAYAQEVENKNAIAADLCNIGNVYEATSNYSKALEYGFNAIFINREIGDKNGLALNLGNLGRIYIILKDYPKAKKVLDSALLVAKDIGDKEDIKVAYDGLSSLNTAKGNYKQALADYKSYIVYRDSLINEANIKKSVQAEMNFNFEQKQASEKAEQNQKDALAEQERKKQTIIRNAFVAGFLLMLALAFFIFRSYRQKQKANIIITQQKEEVEKQKALVESQKALVEEKNKDILDSITYAKRLQDAILPPLNLVKLYLPESFLLYKPKDIVAGDFYWMEKAGDTIFIAAADCTGHGVPGAMVSVVCSNALNRTVKEFKITEPGKILDKVRELVLETFEKSESNVQDGMDISLCSINSSTYQAYWSGAFNPLWYIHNEDLHEIMADKQPIGKTENPKPFITHTLKLKKGSTLYLFTDGYADQFGGPKGKKFKYKQLQELLLANATHPMDEQKKTLETNLNQWKGNLEQVDDILVIGIRV